MDVLETLVAEMELRVQAFEEERVGRKGVERAPSQTAGQSHWQQRVQDLEQRVEQLLHENERLRYRVQHLVRSLGAGDRVDSVAQREDEEGKGSS
ncbi:hypothetical protein CDCA_CDCA09G2622 [Cyanidium caldarium]|uniref:Uncharacterized protein n=1 Tax=Cyanidium caldarium TaxID=2771 RepID=A0AAV9IW87_CYACA|nr:hypothetical protein CDCA_CDCA09G2622 [Cyanidium caldarium]